MFKKVVQLLFGSGNTDARSAEGTSSTEDLREKAARRLAEADLLEAELRLQSLKKQRRDLAGQSKFVRLCVGTIEYRADREMLLVSPLLRMLLDSPPESGRADEDGSYFIDRDGQIFEHVLHYLRYGELSPACQHSAELRRRVAHDATYFQLPRLELLCHLGFKHGLLPEEDVEALNGARQLMAGFKQAWTRGSRGMNDDPFLGLVDIYAEGEELRPALGRSVVATQGLLGLDLAQAAEPWEVGADDSLAPYPSSLEAFMENLRATTAGLLGDPARPLPQAVRKHCVVAGGAVTAALCGQNRVTDVDFFVHGLSSSTAAVDLIVQLADHIKRLSATHEVLLHRSQAAVTICAGEPLAHAQVVLRMHSCPAEVLASFDMAPCQCLFDPLGGRVYATPWALRSLQTRVNVADPTFRWVVNQAGDSNWESRLVKYAARGFAICLPGFEPPLMAAVGEGEAEDSARGLPRLLKLLEAEPLIQPHGPVEGIAKDFDFDCEYNIAQQGNERDPSWVLGSLRLSLSTRLASNNPPQTGADVPAPFLSDILVAVKMVKLPRTGMESSPEAIHDILLKVHNITRYKHRQWVQDASYLVHDPGSRRQREDDPDVVFKNLGPCPALGYTWQYFKKHQQVTARRAGPQFEGEGDHMQYDNDWWYDHCCEDDKSQGSFLHIALATPLEFARSCAEGSIPPPGAADRYIRKAYKKDIRLFSSW